MQLCCGAVQGKKARMTMSLTNNGILPAVARISMEAHPCFRLAPGPQLITLTSKQSHQLAVEFKAVAVKQYAHEVRCCTHAVLVSVTCQLGLETASDTLQAGLP